MVITGNDMGEIEVESGIRSPGGRESILPALPLKDPPSPMDKIEKVPDKVLDVERQDVSRKIPNGKMIPWVTAEKWRRNFALAGIFLGLFFSTLDSSIIATALVTIVDDFQDFGLSSWIVLAYMLTYMSFAMAFARFSDIYGRKTMVIVAWTIFTAFSLGCGLAQTMVQLIVFRAFQGLGGAGLYSMTFILIPEIAPESMAGISGLIGMTLGCSGVLGPILGGVISHFTTWRWIFLINVPPGVLIIACIVFLWPSTTGSSLFSWSAFLSIDFLGIFFVLFASILHVYGFEAAGTSGNDWSTPAIVAVIALSATGWVAFIIWEVVVSTIIKTSIMPIFPMAILSERVMAALFVSTFLTGWPFIVIIITLPERFQLVNGASPLMSGVYLLPLLAGSAFGSFLGGAISKKRNLTSYTLIAAAALQLLGLGLLSTLGDSLVIPRKQYVFQTILGLGIGIAMSSITIMAIIEAKRGDLATIQGSIAQVRMLGGVIGLTIATTLFNKRSDAALASSSNSSNPSINLTPTQISALHRSPLAALGFSAQDRDFVRTVYAGVFTTQMRVLMYVGIVAVVVALGTWRRVPLDAMERMKAHQGLGPGIVEEEGGRGAVEGEGEGNVRGQEARP